MIKFIKRKKRIIKKTRKKEVLELNIELLKKENYIYWNIYDKTFYTEDKLFNKYNLYKGPDMLDFYSWLKTNGSITIDEKIDFGDLSDVPSQYLKQTKN
ncbi:hypothetical protein EMELA_v1c04220 [Mesoplasma melaleucae]|uniref:Uncharacterized protein n=1 Tax=Mesoplasma melaleucae TaxID=81459 RepID=A0A2K8NWR6_9MOLU|nr:hypothetical protein [Mesoplasma melaleucae]ATZ17976.1 hypothetical protein EMELA_v1c04220 [Mesoplasma melaleucae]